MSDALLEAIQARDVERLAELLTVGAAPNAKSLHGFTPFPIGRDKKEEGSSHHERARNGGPTRAHGCARALSFFQAARVCSTSRRRTASAGACKSSGTRDHRSIEASNAASGSSTFSVRRASRAARSWPSIILRSAAAEPNGASGVDMPGRYHAPKPARTEKRGA